MNKVPKSIKIGPYHFNLTIDSLNENGRYIEGVTGVCHPEKLLIEIEKNLAPQILAETLLHEILHACFFAAGIKKDEEEELIRSLSPVVYGFIRDNPAIISILDGSES